MPAALLLPGLNEYDGFALTRIVHSGPLLKPDSPEAYRARFRLMRQALAKWVAAETEPTGMPIWRDFVAGVTGALDHVREQHHGDVLIVSSGGRSTRR